MIDERNPWRRLDRQVVYEVPWFTLYRDTVINPVGRETNYSVIEPKLAVGVIALNEKSEVTLVGQYRYPIDRYSWEIIEGGVEAGESPQVAAERELREEAGLKAGTWTPLGKPLFTSNCFTSECAVVFIAQDLSPVPAQPEESEVLSVRSLPISELLRLLDDGTITDAISIIALYRARDLLGWR